MSLKTSRLWVLLLGAAAFQLQAADEDHLVSFLTCPIARDAGADADLCFVADYQGQLIALVNPPDWGNPQLHHQILIEGVIKGEPGACGARKFEGRASVMPEISPACGVILPYDGTFKGAAGGVFNSGSAAQRAYAQQLAERVPTEPAASIEPAILDAPALPAPQPPFTHRELLVIYPFGSTRGSGPDMAKLREIADYARLIKAQMVSVTGFRATSKLNDGQILVEAQGLARDRAEKVSGIMRRLGVDEKRLSVQWQDEPIAGNGGTDWQNRKVHVEVTP